MFSTLPLLLAFLPIQMDDAHLKLNDLYHQLATKGVTIEDTHRIPMQAAWMPASDAKTQKAALQAVLEKQYTLDRFVRKSVAAPRVLKVSQVDAPKVTVPVYAVDFAFVAYGDLQFFDDIQRYNKLLSGIPQRQQTVLQAADLAKRNLKAKKTDSAETHYIRDVGQFLTYFEISLTSKIVLSRDANSILMAKVADPSFVGDKEFPNFWQPLKRIAGTLKPVEPKQPYTAIGGYAKATKLMEPKGAVFVEFHFIYAEPKEWFDGANLLRSKLPLLTHFGALAFRAELAAWSKANDSK